MAEHLIWGYKLYVNKNTDNEIIGYFATKKEMEEYIEQEGLKGKGNQINFSETSIPDTSEMPRYYVMLTLKNNSHIESEFYGEDDLERFINRYRDRISPAGINIIDRRKVQSNNSKEFFGKAVMVVIGILTLYFILK